MRHWNSQAAMICSYWSKLSQSLFENLGPQAVIVPIHDSKLSLCGGGDPCGQWIPIPNFFHHVLDSWWNIGVVKLYCHEGLLTQTHTILVSNVGTSSQNCLHHQWLQTQLVVTIAVNEFQDFSFHLEYFILITINYLLVAVFCFLDVIVIHHLLPK